MRRAITLAIFGLMLLPLPAAAQSTGTSHGQGTMMECSSEQMMHMADMMGDMQHDMTMVNEMLDQMKHDMMMGSDVAIGNMGAGSGMGHMDAMAPMVDMMAEHMAMTGTMMEQMHDEMGMMAAMHEMMGCPAMPGGM